MIAIRACSNTVYYSLMSKVQRWASESCNPYFPLQANRAADYTELQFLIHCSPSLEWFIDHAWRSVAHEKSARAQHWNWDKGISEQKMPKCSFLKLAMCVQTFPPSKAQCLREIKRPPFSPCYLSVLAVARGELPSLICLLKVTRHECGCCHFSLSWFLASRFFFFNDWICQALLCVALFAALIVAPLSSSTAVKLLISFHFGGGGGDVQCNTCCLAQAVCYFHSFSLMQKWHLSHKRPCAAR